MRSEHIDEVLVEPNVVVAILVNLIIVEGMIALCVGAFLNCKIRDVVAHDDSFIFWHGVGVVFCFLIPRHVCNNVVIEFVFVQKILSIVATEYLEHCFAVVEIKTDLYDDSF